MRSALLTLVLWSAGTINILQAAPSSPPTSPQPARYEDPVKQLEAEIEAGLSKLGDVMRDAAKLRKEQENVDTEDSDVEREMRESLASDAKPNETREQKIDRLTRSRDILLYIINDNAVSSAEAYHRPLPALVTVDTLREIINRKEVPEAIRVAGEAEAAPAGSSAADAPRAGPALVYLFRQVDREFMAPSPSIYCDGVEVAELGWGRYFALELPAGRHEISLKRWNSVTLDLRPGQEAYVELEALSVPVVGPPGSQMRLELRLRPMESTAAYQIGYLRPIEKDKIKDSRVRTTTPPSMQARGQEAGRTTAPGGEALLHVYRLPYGLGLVSPEIYADGAELASMHQGHFFTVRLEAGRHTLHLKGGQFALPVILVAGRPTYVRFQGDPSNAAPQRIAWRFVEVSETQALSEMSEMKPLDQKKIRDPRVTSNVNPAATAAASGAARTAGGWRDEFSIAAPDGWHVDDQGDASGRTGGLFGVISFSEKDRTRIEIDPNRDLGQQSQEIAGKFDSGEWASFFVDRYPAVEGMTCEGVDEAAKSRLLGVYTGKALGRVSGLLSDPQVEPSAIGGCQGLKVLVRAGLEGGGELDLLVYTVSDGKVTYDFALRNERPGFEKNRPVFEKAVSTVRLARK